MLSWLGGTPASALAERRKLARRECYAEVVAYLINEGELAQRSIKGVVLDAGLGGLRLRCYEPLARGQLMALEFQEHLQGVWVNKIRCTVLWSYRNKAKMDIIAGLAYAEDKLMMSKSWIKFVLEDIGFTPDTMHERRQTLRVKTRMDAHLFASDPALAIDMETTGTVRNLSLGGLSIDSMEPILEGRRVEIQLPSAKGRPIKLQGLVRGVVPNRGTRRFAHCISFEDLTAAQDKIVRAEVARQLKRLSP